MRATRRVALALDALRHGWPVEVDGVLRLLPAETGFGPQATAPRLLISAARAATLKLANQREAAAPDFRAYAAQIELFEKIEIEVGEVGDIVQPVRRVGGAEARMLGSDDVELFRQPRHAREPDSFLGLLGLGLSMGQWLCVPMMLFGIYLMTAKHTNPAQ